MDSGQRPLSTDLISLEDYHRRLTQLLERMEQLEESLKSLPLASRKYNNDDVNDNDIVEQEIDDDKPLKKDLKSVELDKEKSLIVIDKGLDKKEEKC